MTLHFTHTNITPEEEEIIDILRGYIDKAKNPHGSTYRIFPKEDAVKFKSFLAEYSRKETRIAELESEIARMKEAEGKMNSLPDIGTYENLRDAYVYNGQPCKNGCNCIEIAETKNGGPVFNYPCLFISKLSDQIKAMKTPPNQEK